MGGEQGVEPTDEVSRTFVANGIELDREDTRQARVLYDYEAVDENELSVYCEEVDTHTHTPCILAHTIHTRTHPHTTGDKGDPGTWGRRPLDG